MFARSVLYVVFLASGASALIFQAGWQRILSLHAGMDLFSVTTVVAAFMAGLGLGNLFGGWLADRLRPRAAVWAYATAELLIGAFGWSSVFILYESYPAFSEYITSTARAFAFHFALLVVPTCLMGMTLPLLARGVVEKDLKIAPLVGRLYGVNAFGAALGALATSGGWLLGRIGLEYAIYAAAPSWRPGPRPTAWRRIAPCWRGPPSTASPASRRSGSRWPGSGS